MTKNIKFAPAEIVQFVDAEDVAGRMILPKNLLVELAKQFDLDILGITDKSGDVTYIEKEVVNHRLVNKVVDAIAMLKRTSYADRMNNIVIKYVEFFRENTLGMADNGVIYLSTKLDTRSVEEIAKIIIEENEHNITGYSDFTREFQDHLFSLLFDELRYGKERFEI